MNTIFIDVNNFKGKTLKNEKIVYNKSIFKKIIFNLLKFSFLKDTIEANLTSNIMYLNIDEDYIKTISKENKFKLRSFILIKYLNYKIKKMDEIYLIYSNKLDKLLECKKYIFNIFKYNVELCVNEIYTENTMQKNDLLYIDDFVKNNKISLNKLKILVVVDNKKDYIKSKMTEYIEKYKFVDVLRMSNINKIDYKFLQNEISSINEEYGSTIDIIQKRNIQTYNIYIFFSDIDKNEFKSHYIVRKQAKFINMKNPDEDYLGKACKSYEKSKYEIETLFNRMGIHVENFSKNKLGCFMMKK
jgi:hypothetical protein